MRVIAPYFRIELHQYEYQIRALCTNSSFSYCIRDYQKQYFILYCLCYYCCCCCCDADDDESEGASETAAAPATRSATGAGGQPRDAAGAHAAGGVVGVGVGSTGDPSALLGEAHSQSAKLLKMKLDELSTCFDLLTRHLSALQPPGAESVSDAPPTVSSTPNSTITTPGVVNVSGPVSTSSSISTSNTAASASSTASAAASTGVLTPTSQAAQPMSSSGISTIPLVAAAGGVPQPSRNFTEQAALYRVTAQAMHKVRHVILYSTLLYSSLP